MTHDTTHSNPVILPSEDAACVATVSMDKSTDDAACGVESSETATSPAPVQPDVAPNKGVPLKSNYSAGNYWDGRYAERSCNFDW